MPRRWSSLIVAPALALLLAVPADGVRSPGEGAQRERVRSH